MRIFYLIAILWLCCWDAWGQRTPKYSNEFLAIGAGARALGMGNAQTAITNDATAGYWNPAGLLNIEEPYAISLMHAAWFAGIANYDFAAFATPIDSRSHIGVSLLRFGVDDIPDTRFLFDADGRLNYDNVRSFNAADYALLISYARRTLWLEGLQVGGNFKIIYRNVGQFANAWGFGIDLGAQLQRDRWSFGLVCRDATGTWNNWFYNPETFFDIFAQTGNTIPENSVEVTMPRLMADVAYNHQLHEKVGATYALGFDLTLDGARNTLVSNELFSVDPRVGLELDYQKTVFVRAGANGLQQIKDFQGQNRWSFMPAIGLGIRLKGVQVDYAFTNVGDTAESLYSHIVSLNFNFYPSKDRRPRL